MASASLEHPSRAAAKQRITVLFLLGVLLVAPFVWTQWDPRRTVAAAMTAVGTSSLSQSEVGEERMLLGNTTLDILPEPERPCRYEENLPRLVTVQQWTSNKMRPRESITLMTQLSADRLSMLENQCRTWQDPIIAVIYVPLVKGRQGERPSIPTYQNTTLEDVIRGINSFHSFMEGTAMCALRIELVGQYLDPEKLSDPAYPLNTYPINSLRNRALTLATTELVMLLDVDFVASPMLGLPEPGYRDPAVYKQMVDLTAKKRALVLPAFEITNRRQDLTMAQNFARNMVVAGKEEVRKAYKSGSLDTFNRHGAPWGHGATNTTKWVRLSRPILYRIQYEPKYEPFVIMARHLAPWADERFVGYGGNKIVYISQLDGLGFGFHVHPYGFSIHVPHKFTKAANIFVVKKMRGQSTEVDELRRSVVSEIKQGLYKPPTNECSAVEEKAKKKRKEEPVDDGQDDEA